MKTKLLLFLSACVSVCAQTPPNCTTFIIMDVASTQTSSDVYNKVQQSFCGNEAAAKSSAESSAVKAGIPVPVLDAVLALTFDGQTTSSQWEAWQKKFCSSTYDEVASKFSHVQLSSVFSNNARDTIKECLGRPGLYGYYELNAGRARFTFQARYKPNTSETWTLREAEIRPTDAVKDCNTADLFSLKGDVKRDLREPVTTTCAWDSSKGVVITLRTDGGGDYAYSLPPMPARPRAAAPVAIQLFSLSQTSIHRGQPVQINWSTVNAAGVTLNGVKESPAGTKTDTPSDSKVYTLVANGKSGPVSQSVSLKVWQHPLHPEPTTVRLDPTAAPPGVIVATLPSDSDGELSIVGQWRGGPQDACDLSGPEGKEGSSQPISCGRFCFCTVGDRFGMRKYAAVVELRDSGGKLLERHAYRGPEGIQRGTTISISMNDDNLGDGFNQNVPGNEMRAVVKISDR